ncbi:hypothetical protein MPTK1_5g11020 [Marchantia polymorpha subsp. ruderalis]|uniref:Uncharacterized protein n=2 Tax=Marchantia polymorpha TaxID=3197 RepID=A0AAF6BH49_MARPO|nr:hypothetical protein MARPO_0093s0024 [Marchantia polymorpha]BBN11333.1 hypothetical protein Mp_5g11020 [Marchantia polymorpha subsp. ruderalis]|eukprot:PTQ32941.1 hypothetical protein MARPO_0093s0024 [Marchantia polymorpha]
MAASRRALYCPALLLSPARGSESEASNGRRSRASVTGRRTACPALQLVGFEPCPPLLATKQDSDPRPDDVQVRHVAELRVIRGVIDRPPFDCEACALRNSFPFCILLSARAPCFSEGLADLVTPFCEQNLWARRTEGRKEGSERAMAVADRLSCYPVRDFNMSPTPTFRLKILEIRA